MIQTIFDRTDLRISVSKAKFDEEADFKLRCALAPQNHAKSAKNKLFDPNFLTNNFFFGVEKRNVGNRLKRVLAKFRADPSRFRGVNGRSKFRKIRFFIGRIRFLIRKC